MLHYPHFDPIALQVGPLAIHWYGLMYLCGFALVWVLGRWRINHGKSDLTVNDLEDIIFYSVLGVVVGGRLGYVLFYQPSVYFAHLAHKKRKSLLEIGDFVAPLIPLGLAAGRLGNFINGELWGRPTTMPWGMVFPQTHDGIPRHPSQLYEMGLEGFALFALVWWFSSKPRPIGQTSAVFLMGYGTFRFLVEFTRAPDYFLGLLLGGLSMGQLLSLPMILIGAIIFVWSAKKSPPSSID